MLLNVARMRPILIRDAGHHSDVHHTDHHIEFSNSSRVQIARSNSSVLGQVSAASFLPLAGPGVENVSGN